MPKDFGDYSLDEPPVCPRCLNANEIGIYENGYYCLDCGFPFLSFHDYSNGYPRCTLPQVISDLTSGKVKVIDVESYTVTHDKKIEYTNNVTDIDEFKLKLAAKQVAAKVKTTDTMADILPDDYEECADCGFDHGYDQAPAMRWHQEHPDSGACLTQDDLVLE